MNRIFLLKFKRLAYFLKSIGVALLIYFPSYPLLPVLRWTAFCSVSVLGIEGVSRGYRGPFEGVGRALALRTPSIPLLNPH